MRKFFLIFPIVLFFVSCEKENSKPGPEYQKEMEQWKKKRLQAIIGEGGWGTLVGLEWLKDGENTMGSDSTNTIIFPWEAPADLGSFFKQGDEIIFKAYPDVDVMVADSAVDMVSVTEESNPVFQWETFQWYIIKRGNKYGVRIKNSQSEIVKNFKGLHYFPLDPKWRVKARFEKHDPPKTMKIQNVLGMIDDYPNPGKLTFKIDGDEYTLEALDEGTDEYFIIFSDETSDKETYGSGRYMYIPKEPVDGYLTLDFNKAYNPPCAFTPYATCPLPPVENQLPIAVTAGELMYH